MLDSVKNFIEIEASTGYDADATSITLKTGDGAKLPIAPFNLTWWNNTDFLNPADDPNVEIVRVTEIIDDTLTIIRAQEGTVATAKNITDKVYHLILSLTAKMIEDIDVAISSKADVVHTHSNTDIIDPPWFVPGTYLEVGTPGETKHLLDAGDGQVMGGRIRGTERSSDTAFAYSIHGAQKFSNSPNPITQDDVDFQNLPVGNYLAIKLVSDEEKKFRYIELGGIMNGDWLSKGTVSFALYQDDGTGKPDFNNVYKLFGTQDIQVFYMGNPVSSIPLICFPYSSNMTIDATPKWLVIWYSKEPTENVSVSFSCDNSVEGECFISSDQVNWTDVGTRIKIRGLQYGEQGFNIVSEVSPAASFQSLTNTALSVFAYRKNTMAILAKSFNGPSFYGSTYDPEEFNLELNGGKGIKITSENALYFKSPSALAWRPNFDFPEYFGESDFRIEFTPGQPHAPFVISAVVDSDGNNYPVFMIDNYANIMMDWVAFGTGVQINEMSYENFIAWGLLSGRPGGIYRVSKPTENGFTDKLYVTLRTDSNDYITREIVTTELPKYTITGEVDGGNGSITPSSIDLIEGLTQVFNIVADENYKIASLVDSLLGSILDAVGQTSYDYTVIGTAEARTITAVFEPIS